MSKRDRILVVDDEPGVRSVLGAILGDEGYEVFTASSGEEAVETMAGASFDAVLLDVWLPGMDGMETLGIVREKWRDVAVVMISGHGTIETAVRATRAGAFDFVEKPLSLDRTLLVLRNALRQRRLERRNRVLLDQLARDTEIHGSSPAAERSRREVDAAAASDASVVLAGEGGSGRAALARRIHSLGTRRDHPFVTVPCGAVADAAEDDILFRSASGPGRIALAGAGTLFLEEANRLSSALRARIADELDSLAGSDAGDAPRVMASVRPDDPGLVDAFVGRFEAIRIDVPPLRARREDIGVLAVHFMGDLAREYGRREKTFEREALAALAAYGWPGNVAELRHVVERLLLLSSRETIGIADLPAEMGGEGIPVEDLYREFESLAEGLEAFERSMVLRVVAATGRDLDAAARRLGVTRPHLETRLRAFDAL